MNPDLQTLRRSLSLSVGLLVGVGCSTSNDPPTTDPPASDFNQEVAQLGPWNGAFADTTPAASQTLPQSIVTAANGDNYVCSNTQLDEKKNLDALLVPGNTAGVLWPGALVQGGTVIGGNPAELPLPRSPLTISIDLAVDSASRRIDSPSSASVQVAVAQLQRAADSRLGPIDVVPARIDFERTEAFASNQFMLDFGASAKLSAPLKALGIPAPGTGSVGVNDSAGLHLSFTVHTLVVKLMQPMYTISFADEEKLDPSDYLAPSVSTAQVQDVVARGMLGPNNQPVYVKSVTYGRMLVFTMRNTTSATTADLEAAVQASFNTFKLGGSASSKLTVRDSLLLSNSDLQVLAFGGSQDSALAAIRSGDLGLFFAAVPATEAVPLSYRINYLRDGSVALLGADAPFTRSDCAAAGTSARYWYLRFDSLTTTGNCPALISDSAFVFAGDTGSTRTGIEYILLAQDHVPVKDTTVNKQIVIPLPGTGPVGLQAWSSFKDASAICSSGATSCAAERIFGAATTLPVVPYQFSQFVSLPGQASGCVAGFYWDVFTKPILAPPVPSPAS